MGALYGSAFQGTDPIYRIQLDGEGGCIPVDVNAVAGQKQPMWAHLDYLIANNQRWLRETDLLPVLAQEGLTNDVIRPRIVRIGEAALITLQTINNNEGDRPDQLVAFRIWISSNYIISTRHRKVHSIQTIQDDLLKGEGAKNTGEWLAEAAFCITDEVADFIEDLHDKLIDMEDAILEPRIPARGELALLRKQLIVLRRYMAPQRDVFARLASERYVWLSDEDRHQLTDVSDRLGRIIDDIDSCIARTSVISDEITNMMADAMNRRTYTMSLLAMVFLPTTFLTGLFGVNLGGIPGGDFPFAFSLFCVGLAGVIGFVAWWLRKSNWL
ncbi:zinc transporter ZntB [Morganella psychrotolerans]|uniref:zinc transporter ZntB n=1 Tax=Morganella psychrotolerans TaxID=368603 RepID=UPI0039B09827